MLSHHHKAFLSVSYLFAVLAGASLPIENTVAQNAKPSRSIEDSLTCSPHNRTVTILAILKHPEALRGRWLRLCGRLMNKSPNYFAGISLVLQDDAGNEVPVTAHLPIEVAPAPNSSNAAPPATLSSFLGRTVEVTATISRCSDQSDCKHPRLDLLSVKSVASP